MGDTADGIPGIPGWGEKSAAAVLGALRHLEAIPDDAHAGTSRCAGRDRLAASLPPPPGGGLYQTLATVRTDVPLAEDLEALAWRAATRLLEAMGGELGYGQLLARVPRWRPD